MTNEVHVIMKHYSTIFLVFLALFTSASCKDGKDSLTPIVCHNVGDTLLCKTKEGVEMEFLVMKDNSLQVGTADNLPGAGKYPCIKNRYFTSIDTITIPESVDGYPVKSIGKTAFFECQGSLSVIVIPNSIEKIGDFAPETLKRRIKSLSERKKLDKLEN